MWDMLADSAARCYRFTICNPRGEANASVARYRCRFAQSAVSRQVSSRSPPPEGHQADTLQRAKMKDRIQLAFGANFAEVRVHVRTREIRTPQVVGAFAAGQIVDPVTAKSQLMGGLIWGAALMRMRPFHWPWIATSR
jgi:CO/xanthine dehydrogenase Mo-binding subunit